MDNGKTAKYLKIAVAVLILAVVAYAIYSCAKTLGPAEAAVFAPFVGPATARLQRQRRRSSSEARAGSLGSRSNAAADFRTSLTVAPGRSRQNRPSQRITARL